MLQEYWFRKSCSRYPHEFCAFRSLCGTEQAADPLIGTILGLLDIVVQGVDALLGLECSPIKIVGLGGGGACSSNVVCCENNSIVRSGLLENDMR